MDHLAPDADSMQSTTSGALFADLVAHNLGLIAFDADHTDPAALLSILLHTILRIDSIRCRSHTFVDLVAHNLRIGLQVL
jgi:hypothetical protein